MHVHISLCNWLWLSLCSYLGLFYLFNSRYSWRGGNRGFISQKELLLDNFALLCDKSAKLSLLSGLIRSVHGTAELRLSFKLQSTMSIFTLQDDLIFFLLAKLLLLVILVPSDPATSQVWCKSSDSWLGFDVVSDHLSWKTSHALFAAPHLNNLVGLLTGCWVIRAAAVAAFWFYCDRLLNLLEWLLLLDKCKVACILDDNLLLLFFNLSRLLLLLLSNRRLQVAQRDLWLLFWWLFLW